MDDKDSYLKNAELSTEQNYDIIDGILNNITMPISPSVPVPEEKPLDRVKKPTRRKRSQELER